MLHLLIGALDADALDDVGGVADAGGVDEAEGDATEVDGVFDDVAGGAVDVAHDGSLFAYEGVEEGGLAHVGLADDGYGHAVLDGIAYVERMGQAGDDTLDLVSYLREFATVGKLELFVVAEIELQLHERGEVQELVAQHRQFLAEASAQLAQGEAVRGGRGGGDEVGHGFGLAEVHLAIEEGTLGVLARCGKAASAIDEEAQGLLEDIGGAMTRDLYRVFARIGVGRTEEGDEHLVEHGAVSRDEMPEHGGARLALGERGPTDGAEVVGGDADGLGATDADDADGATLSGGNGADGVG